MASRRDGDDVNSQAHGPGGRADSGMSGGSDSSFDSDEYDSEDEEFDGVSRRAAGGMAERDFDTYLEDNPESQDEENPVALLQRRRQTSALQRDDFKLQNTEPSRLVMNPLHLATHGNSQQHARLANTSSGLKRQRSKRRKRKAYHSEDVERAQQAIKRISGILDCDLSESLVTLGILLIILIYEGQQIKKADESKFGESLKFRCTYALEQHTQPMKQGWLKKQGEMGEKFKQRWFVLLPDAWTFRNSSEFHRILLFYRTEPKTVEERLAPKGAVMLHHEKFKVILVTRGRDSGLHHEIRLEVTEDVDGFIDAGEMRYNYVFAPASKDASSQLSRTSTTPKSMRSSRMSSAASKLPPEAEFEDWFNILDPSSPPDPEDIERMMPESPQDRAVAETCEKLQCDRASIFLLDDRNDELVLHVGKGAEAREIRIPRTAGIAGECLRLNQTLLINDPYSDPRFNQATDKKTGYRTTSILAVPITDGNSNTIGVLQAINKLPPAEGFDADDQTVAMQLAASEQLSRASMVQAEAHARLEGKNWRARQKSGFNAGKISRFNISTTKKFIFFSVVVCIVQTFAALKLLANAERFEPDEVVAFILEGYLRVMNCSQPETLELYPVYTACDLLVGDGKNIGRTYKGENRLTRGQMADTFADTAADRRLLDLPEGGYVAPLAWPWSDSDDRLWGGGMPQDEGQPNILCFTEKGVKNGIVNVVASEMIVGYFIVGEVYQMGRGIFLFVGGPLASLIAPVRKGHRIFYFINSLQAFVLLTILIASWRRIFTVCQDFWMCVETSVSVFVVLELDDRILPMMREDLKRKCRRSLKKRGIVINDKENHKLVERAQNTRISAGREYTLHGFCMAYFFSVLFFAGYETSLFAC